MYLLDVPLLVFSFFLIHYTPKTMPTTRFASSTGNTDSPALNGNTTAESIQEQRQKSFNGRKKREVPNDLTPKQKIMIQFIDHITE